MGDIAEEWSMPHWEDPDFEKVKVKDLVINYLPQKSRWGPNLRIIWKNLKVDTTSSFCYWMQRPCDFGL